MLDPAHLDAFSGITLIPNPLVPKTQPKRVLPQTVTVNGKKLELMLTDEFREKFNKFLLEFFGEEPVVYMMDNDCGQAVVGHPLTIDTLRKAVRDLEEATGVPVGRLRRRNPQHWPSFNPLFGFKKPE